MYGTHATNRREDGATGAVGPAVSETPVGIEPTWTGLQPVAAPPGSSVNLLQCPRQELNLVCDFRRVACDVRHTPRTGFVLFAVRFLPELRHSDSILRKFGYAISKFAIEAGCVVGVHLNLLTYHQERVLLAL